MAAATADEQQQQPERPAKVKGKVGGPCCSWAASGGDAQRALVLGATWFVAAGL
jgi:hypothetical protein